MTVLDLGCGTGYFTLETAKLLDNNGKVIAADVQKGMLDILKQKLHVSKDTFNSIISKMENKEQQSYRGMRFFSSDLIQRTIGNSIIWEYGTKNKHS